MKTPRSLLFLPFAALALEDDSTLLSLHRAELSADVEQSSVLLQAAASRNVTQMQALVQTMMEESIKGDGVAQLDDDIRGAMDIIRTTLLKGIKDTLISEHRQDQIEIMEQLKCFDGCRKKRTFEEKKCNSHVREFEHLVETHKSCRLDLKAQYIAKVNACGTLDDWVAGFILEPKVIEECVYDGAYECHTKECEEGECDPDIKDQFGKWLKTIIQQAEHGYERWLILHKKCKAEYHAYISLDSRCDMVEKEQERANGETRQCEYTACEIEYTKCRADCIAEYHKLVKRIECAEKDRKVDWSAAEKIECYIRILLNSPTNEQLQAVCEDGENCISKWRAAEYEKCEAVCENIDYDSWSYSQHERRDAESGEYLHIDATSTVGKDGKLEEYTESTQKNIQHADDEVIGDLTEGVNTTHRHRRRKSREYRCTQHLDIDFQPIPCAIPCYKPRPCCDEEYKKLYEDPFMGMDSVSGRRVCHDQAPGEHSEKWAYNLCTCCKSHCELIGTPTITEDDYCDCPSHGERPAVHMEYRQTNVCLHTRDERPGTVTLPANMCVDRIDFKHRSGYVTCHANGEHRSNWGCSNHMVAVVMTKADSREVAMPTVANTAGFSKDPDANHWYQMEGVNRDTTVLTWQVKDGVYNMKMEGAYKVWYNEDLHDYTEGDNDGQVCYDMEVFGEYC